MQLILEESRARWEAITKYGEPAMHLPKASGFKWDSNITRWHSVDALAAIKLRDYADKATQAKLDVLAAPAKVAADAKAHAAAEAVVASRATDSAITIPAPDGLSYLPFQRAGIAYAIQRKDTLIADEMGLGKTIQGLGTANVMLSERTGNLSVLVVGPKISLFNWSKEAAKWLIRPHTIAIWTAKKQPAADVVIVNYDILSRPAVAEALRARTWDLAIFDEAHVLKTTTAARTKAVLGSNSRDGKVEPIRAGRRLFLTGTPLLNRPVELFPILNSMEMPEAKDYWKFANRYCSAYRTDFGLDVSGSSNLPELQSAMRAFGMVRRLKADVLTELPPKRYSVVQIEADTADLKRAIAAEQKARTVGDAEEARLGAAIKEARAVGDEAAVKAAVAKLSAVKLNNIAEISKLRHDTAVAKIPQVIEHVTGFLDGSEEAILVMAHHRDVIDGLVAGLAAAGYEAAVITGATSAEDRVRAEEDIQSKRKRVFVGSMHACGVAITLTAASTVAFAEQDWGPSIMRQAADRAHRIGQAGSVLVQYLVVDGSVDVTMAKMVSEKGDVMEAALDTVESEADREGRLAAEQAAKDAAIADALADAKAREAEAEAAAIRRAEQEARRAEDRAAVDLLRIADATSRADMARAEKAASVSRKAMELAEIAAPSQEATLAIHACLKLLADLDPDLASDRNGEGFSATDSHHGHFLAGLEALSAEGAIVGAWLTRRYQGQLPAELVAEALGEPARMRRTAKERVLALADAYAAEVLELTPAELTADAEFAEVSPAVAGVEVEVANDDSPAVVQDEMPVAAALPAEPAARKPGRPRMGAETLTQAERTKRYRESRRLVSVEMSGAIAERIRAARDKRGVTMEELLDAALDALLLAECDALLAA